MMVQKTSSSEPEWKTREICNEVSDAAFNVMSRWMSENPDAKREDIRDLLAAYYPRDASMECLQKWLLRTDFVLKMNHPSREILIDILMDMSVVDNRHTAGTLFMMVPRGTKIERKFYYYAIRRGLISYYGSMYDIFLRPCIRVLISVQFRHAMKSCGSSVVYKASRSPLWDKDLFWSGLLEYCV